MSKQARRSWWWSCLAALLTLVAPAVAEAGDAKKVLVGAYVKSLHAMSLHDNNYTIDFYLWFRWKPEEWKQVAKEGEEAPKLPFETFEIVGASTVEKEVDQQVDGYAALRVKAELTQFWNVERFPFDDHVLRIVVEDAASETHLLQYEADTEGSTLAPEFVVPGWTPKPLIARLGKHEYHTSFGDPNLPTGSKSEYGRVTFEIPIVRQGLGMFLKLFTGLFVSVAIALVAFFVRATEVDPRFGLPVGALFASIASEYVVASALPDSSAVTLADQLHLVSFLAILAVVIESARALSLLQTEEDGVEERVQKMDRRTFVGVAVTWLVAVAFIATRHV